MIETYPVSQLSLLFSLSLSLYLYMYIKYRKTILKSPAGLRPRKTALAMPSSNSKLQARPLVRVGAAE
jgi:hypothetical protein